VIQIRGLECGEVGALQYRPRPTRRPTATRGRFFLAINIDTSKPLRRPLEMAHLVEAVVEAGSADEALWIEWKSDLDLTQAPGRFKTARAILSFANRMPDTASKTCGGLAFVIIGAEPGSLTGTNIIDAADLDKGLIKYLGGDGPEWSPTYVCIGGKNVLVIVVEPPKWGDRIHTLRQQFDGTQAGTVFIRSQSESRQANPEEFRLLEQRLLRGRQSPELGGLLVGFAIGVPNSIVVVDPTTQQIEEWAENRRTAILEWHQAAIAATADSNSTLAASLFRPRIDAQAIEQHLQACREQLLDATRRMLIHGQFSMITMTVTSPHASTLENVELTLTIDTPHSAFHERHAPFESLPPAPRPPRTRSPLDLGRSMGLPGSLYRRSPVADLWIPDNRIDIEDRSITLTIGRVRPGKPVVYAPFHLFLHERPSDNDLTIGWTLTSTSVPGVQRGTTEVPVLQTQTVFLDPTAGIPNESETD
jgi:hypothetical protein